VHPWRSSSRPWRPGPRHPLWRRAPGSLRPYRIRRCRATRRAPGAPPPRFGAPGRDATTTTVVAAQSPTPLPHSSPRSSSSPAVPISGRPSRMRRGPRRSPLGVHGFLLLSPLLPSASLLLSPSLPRQDQQGGSAPRPTWRVPFGLQMRQGWRPRDRTGWSSPLPRETG
jgi:hypothetical protein